MDFYVYFNFYKLKKTLSSLMNINIFSVCDLNLVEVLELVVYLRVNF